MLELYRLYKLRKQLERLLKGKIEFTNCGICSNAGEGIDDLYTLRMYFETWKHYSGNTIFPVPDPEGNVSPVSIYSSTRNMWVGKYGELRKDLVRHILAETKPRITGRLINWIRELVA